MARRRRPGSRSSVVDGRAVLMIPLESIADAADEPMRLGDLKRWLRPVDAFPAPAPDGDPGASVVLDRFAYDLHLSDVGHSTDVHDGDEFVTAVRTHGSVDVFVVDGADPRRSKPDEIESTAATGRMLGGRIAAFEVDVLES